MIVLGQRLSQRDALVNALVSACGPVSLPRGWVSGCPWARIKCPEGKKALLKVVGIAVLTGTPAATNFLCDCNQSDHQRMSSLSL